MKRERMRDRGDESCFSDGKGISHKFLKEKGKKIFVFFAHRLTLYNPLERANRKLFRPLFVSYSVAQENVDRLELARSRRDIIRSAYFSTTRCIQCA